MVARGFVRGGDPGGPQKPALRLRGRRVDPNLEDEGQRDLLNTRAGLRSASRVGLWDLGQNVRNLRELVSAIDQKLIADH